MATPTLGKAFAQTVFKGRNVGPNGMPVTMERITQVLGGGQVEVLGVRIPVTGEGLRTLRAGGQVAVAWQQGRPVVAIVHTARRSGAPVPLPSGFPIVEHLFIAGEAGARDVYFRNDALVATLAIRAQLAGDPEEVKWGARGDDFFVRVGSQYYTFLLDRDDADEPVTSDPTATLLRPPEAPWDGETLLATLQHDVARTIDTPCVFFSEVSTFDDGLGGVDHVTGTGGLASSLVRTGSFTGTGALRLTEAAVGAGNVTVLDAELDFEHNLILTIRLHLLGEEYTPRPTGSVKEVATKAYDRQEEPPGTVVSESGDSSAIDGQPDLGSADIVLGSTAPDGDTYALAVNVTQRSVVWQSIQSEPVLTEEWHAFTQLAGAEHHDITNLPLVLPDHRAVVGNQGLNHFSGASPSTPTPPSGGTILLPVTYAAEALLHLHAIDTAKLGFLALGDLVDELTTSPLVLYGNPFGTVGDVTIPPGSLADLDPIAVQGTFTEHRTYRATTLFLSALRYLPRRTKAGGELLLFARRSLHNGIVSTGTEYSFWRVDAETGGGQVIAPWTAYAGEATPTVLGASLQHVLWTLKVRNPLNLSEQITTVYLTDTEHGTSKDLVTGTETSNDVPPAVAEFLARSWEVLRPDLLYLLDDADEAVRNEFIEAWTDEAVTLDPANPESASEFADLGALADLPEDVVPLAPAVARSVRVLVRPEVDDPEDV